jgi:hypothetical protein
MLVKVISENTEIKDFCYEPLKSGKIYNAEFINKHYTKVFFFIDGEEYEINVHNRHLKELNLDEIREYKLNKIGI